MSEAPAFSAAGLALAARIDAAASREALGAAMQDLYAQFGRLREHEVELLQQRIDARRGAPRAVPPAPMPLPKVLSRFAPRRRQCSPDKAASRARRRDLAGNLPSGVRQRFTEAERAALVVVAGEVKHHGLCDLPIDQIAALAGCSRTTVQNAVREARRLGLVRLTARPRLGQKSLTNLIEITSPEWRTWIKRGPAAHKPTGFKTLAQSRNVNPTKNILEKKGLQESGARPKRGSEPQHNAGAQGATAGPSRRSGALGNL